MTRKLLAALAAILALGLANFSAPAMATPTNTVFDRTVSGCDFEFKYGTVFGAAYAEFRVNGADPSGMDCVMFSTITYWTNGTTTDDTTLLGPYPTGWRDNNVWHNAVKTNATGYGGEWHLAAAHDSTGCVDGWTLDARFNDGDPEGYWSEHVGC